MVREYGPRATFAVEDYGASPLGDKAGVKEYPALFVGDQLFASPRDFFGWGGAPGKYVPWNDLANRRRFQADLRRAIDANVRR